MEVRQHIRKFEERGGNKGSNLLYEPIWLKYCGRRDWWLANLEFVEAYIKEYKLKPVEPSHLGPAALGLVPEAEMAAVPTTARAALGWGPINGGMRMPHLHYAGRVYRLDEAQWADFSRKVVARMTEKLKAAQKIGHDQLMAAADAVEVI